MSTTTQRTGTSETSKEQPRLGNTIEKIRVRRAKAASKDIGPYVRAVASAVKDDRLPAADKLDAILSRAGKTLTQLEADIYHGKVVALLTETEQELARVDEQAAEACRVYQKSMASRRDRILEFLKAEVPSHFARRYRMTAAQQASDGLSKIFRARKLMAAMSPLQLWEERSQMEKDIAINQARVRGGQKTLKTPLADLEERAAAEYAPYMNARSIGMHRSLPS